MLDQEQQPKKTRKNKKDKKKDFNLSKRENFSDKEEQELAKAKEQLRLERERNRHGVTTYTMTPEEIAKKYGHTKSSSDRSSLECVRFMQPKTEDDTMGRKPGSKDKNPRKGKTDKRVNPLEVEDQQAREAAKRIAQKVADILDEEQGEEPPAPPEQPPVVEIDPTLSVQHIQGPCTVKFPEGAIIEQSHDDQVDALYYTESGIVQGKQLQNPEEQEAPAELPAEVPQAQLNALVTAQPKSLIEMMGDQANALESRAAEISNRIQEMREQIIQMERQQVEISTAKNTLLMAMAAMRNIEQSV